MTFEVTVIIEDPYGTEQSVAREVRQALWAENINFVDVTAYINPEDDDE